MCCSDHGLYGAPCSDLVCTVLMRSHCLLSRSSWWRCCLNHFKNVCDDDDDDDCRPIYSESIYISRIFPIYAHWCVAFVPKHNSFGMPFPYKCPLKEMKGIRLWNFASFCSAEERVGPTLFRNAKDYCKPETIALPFFSPDSRHFDGDRARTTGIRLSATEWTNYWHVLHHIRRLRSRSCIFVRVAHCSESVANSLSVSGTIGQVLHNCTIKCTRWMK